MMKVKSPLITVDSKYIPASFRHSKVVKIQGHHGDKSKLYIYGKIKEKRIKSETIFQPENKLRNNDIDDGNLEASFIENWDFL